MKGWLLGEISLTQEEAEEYLPPQEKWANESNRFQR
jgi:hypothetical protein